MGKTHVIDGKKYVKVDRNAREGDTIIAVDFDIEYDYKIGDVDVVKFVWPGSYGVDTLRGWEMRRDEYRVLEPLAVEANPQVTDLIANLAHRVSSLEQQLSSTQANVVKLAEELANVKYFGECNTGDILDLYEHTQPKEVEVFTFEKFLNSVTEDVAKKLAEKVSSDLRTEMRLKALRGF
jgi:hypothetical protein